MQHAQQQHAANATRAERTDFGAGWTKRTERTDFGAGWTKRTYYETAVSLRWDNWGKELA